MQAIILEIHEKLPFFKFFSYHAHFTEAPENFYIVFKKQMCGGALFGFVSFFFPIKVSANKCCKACLFATKTVFSMFIHWMQTRQICASQTQACFMLLNKITI